ncbi:MAG: transcriptional repressor LexA [Clostridia bacterium]|jgi:repressor LexA|nr:transcriptional repressor LexA [Clostridia bacterium]
MSKSVRQTEKIKNEEAVFSYIQKYMTENGFAPCVREVCAACGIKSTATVFNIINRLKDRGLLEKSDVKRRAISLKSKSVSVPLLGTVAAGQPIFAAESYDGYFSLPENFFSGDDLFMLNVKGSSMVKIGMFDGDKVVVRKQQTADNGDIVVALVDDSSTVKRFFKRDGKYVLHPENDDMEDFVYDDVQILGKVVGLIRNI